MSLPNLDTASQQSSNSNNSSNGFWEVGNYRPNVQRIHQGSEQLDELGRFIKERIAIENNYAKHLERWNEEWCHYSAKHFPSGTLKLSLDFVLQESKELAKVHSAVKERFNDEVLKTIELFKKDNYHRSTFRGFKEAKEVEDEFEKAQKQWKKLSERVEAAKRAYHSATRAEKSAYIQWINSKSDNANGSMADGASEKAKERHEKCQEELKRSLRSYQQLLAEIRAYNSVYMENMAFVFEKCQQMEMKRLRFFLEMLSGMQNILVDLVNPPKLAHLHSTLHHHFQTTTDANLGEDLKQWSQVHGVDCPTKWPVFEEYSASIRPISGSCAKSRRNKKEQQQDGCGGGGGGTGVVLTRRVEKREDEAPMNGGGNSRQHWMMVNNRREHHQQGGTELTEEEGNFNFKKQNSIDSQQSRTTSRSSRSHSEKPQQRTNEKFLQRKQLHMQQRTVQAGPSPTFNVPSTTDPLASDPFPMVTPQKNVQSSMNEEGSERSFATNGRTGGAGALVRPEFALTASAAVGGDKAQNCNAPIGTNSAESISTNGSVPLISAKTNGVSQKQGGNNDVQQRVEEELLDQLPPPLPVGPARVLFDYKPIEDDEIELIRGELMDIVSGPDHLGWCLGVKKTGQRGLFPAGYVAPIVNNH